MTEHENAEQPKSELHHPAKVSGEDLPPARAGSARIGCPECAWGKVAGCWRCGSRGAKHG